MSSIFFYSFQTKVDESVFTLGTIYWKEFYEDIKEEITPDMPEPLGKSAHMTCFVDDNHYFNVVTLFYTQVS